MDDSDQEERDQEDGLYDTSHQACFIFRSGYVSNATPKPQPSKKRKLNSSVTNRGTEQPPGLLQRQRQLFDDFWQSDRLQLLQDDVDQKALGQLTTFIHDFHSAARSKRLVTGLLLTGVDATNYATVLQSLNQVLPNVKFTGHTTTNAESLPMVASERRIIADLKPQQCPSLQIALKNIIKSTIIQAVGIDAYDEFLAKQKHLLPLAFDLELLEIFCEQEQISQLVISLSDVETLTNSVINELIVTLHAWKERLQLVLLLGLASTRDLFEKRLSKSCLRLMQPSAFSFVPSADAPSKLMHRAQRLIRDSPQLYLDSSAIATLRDTCQNQGASIQSIEQMLKLIYLSHCLANRVSSLSGKKELETDDTVVAELANTARRTDSFRDYCNDLLAQNIISADSRLRSLMTNDRELLKEVRKQIAAGQKAFSSALQVVNLLADLYQGLIPTHQSSVKSRIEVETLLHQHLSDLRHCVIFHEIAGSLQKTQTCTLLPILDSLEDDVKMLVPILQKRMTVHGNSNGPDTTIQVNGLKARNKASATTNGGNDDGNVAQVLLQNLEQLVGKTSFNASSFLLHEAYILSTRSIRFKQYVEPSPRVAIERAFATPGDYLGCNCCATTRIRSRDNQSPTNPAIEGDEFCSASESTGTAPTASLLFNLLQEAPTIINVRDLFDAFQSRLLVHENRQADDDAEVSATVMTQFYRALAELKMMGLVKESTGMQIKRRGKARPGGQETDFIAKTSWAGL